MNDAPLDPPRPVGQGKRAGADTAVLEDWGLRVLDAASLEDVLA